MMRTIYRLFLLFILILAAVGGYFWWNRAEIVSNLLSEQTEMEVSIQDISFSFGEVTISKLILRDPFSETTVHSDKITVQSTLSQLLSDPIRIHKIAIEDLTLRNTLVDVDPNNLKSLLKFTKKFTKKKKSKKVKTPSSDQKEFLIEEVIADNIVLQIDTGKDRPPIRTRIKQLKLENINSGNPITLHQLVELFSKRLSKAKS